MRTASLKVGPTIVGCEASADAFPLNPDEFPLNAPKPPIISPSIQDGSIGSVGPFLIR